MPAIEGALPKAVATEVSAQMQRLLADFTGLARQGQQTHSHVVGPNCESVHLQLDQLATHARLLADAVAERAVTLGWAVDCSASATVAQSSLPAFPTGYLDSHRVVAEIADRMRLVVQYARFGLDRLDEIDPVTPDLVIGILEALEKHLWMLQAQLSRPSLRTGDLPRALRRERRPRRLRPGRRA